MGAAEMASFQATAQTFSCRQYINPSHFLVSYPKWCYANTTYLGFLCLIGRFVFVLPCILHLAGEKKKKEKKGLRR